MRTKAWRAAAALALAIAAPTVTAAQEGRPVPAPSGAGGAALSLSLDEAIARALDESQEVALARAQIDLVETQVEAARSQLFPQVNANFGYTKTFASSFDTGGGFTIPDSLRFEPDATLPLAERVAYLEDRVPTAALSGIGSLFGDLPFAQENAYTATISGRQLLWSGGRVQAGLAIARGVRSAAQYGLVEEAAEMELQVRTAYYQALLAQELETIAAAALEQAAAFLAQEELRLRAGLASELEVLRAQVTLENLRPQLVQARNAAELAMLNLKRLADIPAPTPVVLTTGLMDRVPPPDAVDVVPELVTAQRASVRAAEQQVRIREAQVDVARSAYQPNVSLQMNYGRQAFPGGVFDLDTNWRTDWSATLNVSIPVFTGFQRSADVAGARVQLEQARLQLTQLEEAVELQYQRALGEKRRAQAEIAARETTVGQAQRVYDLTVLRYEEGLATQLEVSEARLSLLQARTNLAQAVADYHIADAGVTRAITAEGYIPLPDVGDVLSEPITAPGAADPAAGIGAASAPDAPALAFTPGIAPADRAR